MAAPSKNIASNKKAYHDYEILEKFEAGIVLQGTEVKSIRESGLSLKESYASIKQGEAWLMGVHLKPYSHGNRENHDPLRPRKLLLNKREIRYLIGKTKESGLTLIPTKAYFSGQNKVKIELGLARGKKLYDKRKDIAKRDASRELERTLKDRTR